MSQPSEDSVLETARSYYMLWEFRKLWQVRRVTTIDIVDTNSVRSQISFDLDLDSIADITGDLQSHSLGNGPVPLILRPCEPLLDASVVDESGDSLPICRRSTNSSVAASIVLGYLLARGFPARAAKQELFQLILRSVYERSTDELFSQLSPLLDVVTHCTHQERGEDSGRITNELRDLLQLFKDNYLLCVDLHSRFAPLPDGQLGRRIVKFSTLSYLEDDQGNLTHKSSRSKKEERGSRQESDGTLPFRETSWTRLLAMKFPVPLVGFGEDAGSAHVRVRTPEGLVLDDFSLFIPGVTVTYMPDGRSIGILDAEGRELVEAQRHDRLIEVHETGGFSSPSSDRVKARLVLVYNPQRFFTLVPILAVSCLLAVVTSLLLASFDFTRLRASDSTPSAYSILFSILVVFVGTRKEHVLSAHSSQASRVVFLLAGAMAVVAGTASVLPKFRGIPALMAIIATLGLSVLTALMAGFQVARISIMRRPWGREIVRGMSSALYDYYGESLGGFRDYATRPKVYVICVMFLLRQFGRRLMNRAS